MSNKNYIKGRAFEYKRMKAWERNGYTVLRTAGSHGFADLVAVKRTYPVEFIQCKVCKTNAEAQRLINAFATAANLHSPHFHESIEVWVSETRELMVWNG